MTSRKLHKLCSIFPAIEGDDLSELVTDIKTNGLRTPIVTLKGEILDGQNRMNACEAAGVKPKFIEFKGGEKKALEFVVSQNLSRRHLTPSQRAAIAAEISTCRNSDTSAAEAAKKLGVSRDSVQVAKRIKKASKKVAKAVKSGKITLHAAEKKLNLTPAKRQRRECNPYDNTPAPSLSETETPKETRQPGQIAHDIFIGVMGEGQGWDDISAKERSAWIAVAEGMTK